MSPDELKAFLQKLYVRELRHLARNINLNIDTTKNKSELISDITIYGSKDTILNALGLSSHIIKDSEEEAIQIARKGLQRQKWELATAVIGVMIALFSLLTVVYIYYRPSSISASKVPNKQSETLINFSFNQDSIYSNIQDTSRNNENNSRNFKPKSKIKNESLNFTGTVIDLNNEIPMNGVIVWLNDEIKDTTNENGRFELRLVEKQLTDKPIKLFYKKKGSSLRFQEINPFRKKHTTLLW